MEAKVGGKYHKVEAFLKLVRVLWSITMVKKGKNGKKDDLND